jgi:hypothetical protein
LVIAPGAWRRAAQLFALLAVLANAAVLPAIHFAGGGAGVAAEPLLQESGPHGRHARSRDDDAPEKPGGSAHQVCHFCRLLGAALPPPPSAALAVEFASRTVEWPSSDTAILWRQALRTANLPRAPPSRG